MQTRAKASALPTDTHHQYRAPISEPPSQSIESRGAGKGQKWASERAAGVNSGILMGQDQGADDADSVRGFYQEQLRAQGAWFEESHAEQKRQQRETLAGFNEIEKSRLGLCKLVDHFLS